MIHGNAGSQLVVVGGAFGDRRNDAGIGEGRGVAQVAAVGDVAQQAAHDLAGTGLRQVRHEEHGLRTGGGAELLRHVLADLFLEFVRRLGRSDQDHVSDDRLTRDIVSGPDDRRLGDGLVVDERRLDSAVEMR